MLTKPLNIFISILLLLPLFSTGAIGFSQLSNNSLPSFQMACDMDHCNMDHSNPRLPKCPLCPSSGSIVPFLPNQIGDYLPPLASSLIAISSGILSDQEVVRAIFHPPTPVV